MSRRAATKRAPVRPGIPSTDIAVHGNISGFDHQPPGSTRRFSSGVVVRLACRETVFSEWRRIKKPPRVQHESDRYMEYERTFLLEPAALFATRESARDAARRMLSVLPLQFRRLPDDSWERLRHDVGDRLHGEAARCAALGIRDMTNSYFSITADVTIVHLYDEPEFLARACQQQAMQASCFGSQDQCSICLDDLGTGSWEAIDSPCSHAYHGECIKEWFQKAATCPNCRRDLRCLMLSYTTLPDGFDTMSLTAF